MRITEIREKTVAIASPISNAYIDFSKMACSIVAVISDVVRSGKPLVGYGFIAPKGRPILQLLNSCNS